MNPITDKPNSLYLVGTRIISIQGETSDTDIAQDVFTGPNAEGVISQVLTDQEHCYSLAFPLGATVFLSPFEIADSSKYQIDPMTLHTVRIYAIVRVNVFNVEAANHLQAIEKAEEMVDLDALLTRGTTQEFAEDVDCYCVDEVGDEKFTKTRWYEKDGVTCYFQKTSNPSDLKPYCLTLHENKGDSFTIFFECEADDIKHAIEQAENAYPNSEIVGILAKK